MCIIILFFLVYAETTTFTQNYVIIESTTQLNEISADRKIKCFKTVVS